MKRITILLILITVFLIGCSNNNQENSDKSNKTENDTTKEIFDEFIYDTRTNEEYEYDVYADHIEIVEYLGYEKDVIIPQEIDGKPVTKILYFGGETVKSVVIPEGVTHIGKTSEFCRAYPECLFSNNIESVIIPKSVVFIQSGALEDTTWYKQFSDKYNIVGDGILIGQRYEEEETVKFPKGIKRISAGGWGRLGVSSITREIEIPEGVIEIGIGNSKEIEINGEFYLMSLFDLENIKFPSTLKKITSLGNSLGLIHESEWYQELEDEFVIVGDGVLIKTNIPEDKDYVEVPKEVKSISTSITLPYDGKVKIVIPECVNGVYASGYLLEPLKGMENTEVIYGGKDLVEFDYALAWCGIEQYIVSDDASKLGVRALSGNSLKKIIIPKGVIEIGDDSFGGCSSLENIKLPNSLKVIGDGAFGGCTKLKNIEIPKGVRYIGEEAFKMTNISSITIPESVQYIGKDALKTQFTEEKVFHEELGEVIEITCINVDKIYGVSGSCAEEYAKENGIEFVDIG